MLGAYEPIRLRALSTSMRWGSAVRLIGGERGASASGVHLFTVAGFPLSHIRVLLNNQVAATIPFDIEHAGNRRRPILRSIPRFFCRLQPAFARLVSHYTVTNCEDPSNSALWPISARPARSCWSRNWSNCPLICLAAGAFLRSQGQYQTGFYLLCCRPIPATT